MKKASKCAFSFQMELRSVMINKGQMNAISWEEPGSSEIHISILKSTSVMIINSELWRNLENEKPPSERGDYWKWCIKEGGEKMEGESESVEKGRVMRELWSLTAAWRCRPCRTHPWRPEVTSVYKLPILIQWKEKNWTWQISEGCNSDLCPDRQTDRFVTVFAFQLVAPLTMTECRVFNQKPPLMDSPSSLGGAAVNSDVSLLYDQTVAPCPIFPS